MDAFLKDTPNLETNDQGKKKFTDVEWMSEVVRRFLYKKYSNGVMTIAHEKVVVNMDSEAVAVEIK